MFQKLVGNLAFNPSLIGQVSFYAKRIHRESTVRRLGVVFTILAVGVQLIALSSPPQATASQSNNDIIKGGVKTQSEAVAICRQGQSSRTPDFATILQAYGITCDDLARATPKSVSSIGTLSGGKLYSMGRIAYGPTGKKGQPSNEQRVSVAGASGRLYMRLLNRWDSGASSTYRMMVGKSASGLPFAVMYDCGNLVVEKPQPPTPIRRFTPEVVVTPQPKTPMCPLDQTIPLSDTARCKECPYIRGILVGSPTCKPCDKSQDNQDAAACLVLSKKARNDTLGVIDANNTTAQPNNVITYTLGTRNDAKVTIKAFVVEENVNDILDYASVTDTHGGNLTDDGIVRWPATDIAAGSTLVQTLTIKVKSVIPNTPVSSSNPGTYDLVMTNVYGNVVNINLPGNTVKTVEVVTKQLPNTGPGTSVAIGFALTTVVAYFFARSRLLGKELEIIKVEQTHGGL